MARKKKHSIPEVRRVGPVRAITTFVINKGVPIPAYVRGAYNPLYPFRDLKVGDSFAIPALPSDKSAKARLWVARRKRIKKFPDEAYVVASVEEDGKKLVRLWRIA